MKVPTVEEVEASNPLAWVINHEVKNENQIPLEFTKHHTFLVEPYLDWSPLMVIKKCAQVGFSTWAILRAIHWANFRGANVIYTLPNRNLAAEFLIPKFDPIVSANSSISSLLSGTNNVSLKRVGQRFIYFRGTHADTEAIAIAAHGLINDEADRSNQKVLSTYQRRLDHADPPDLRFNWTFSNPSAPDYGVDAKYKESTQQTWLVTCKNGHESPLTWPESINVAEAYYWCSQCHVALTDEDRSKGRWEAKFPGREWQGYWISQMMAPWIPAEKIIKDSQGDVEIFHNYTLGEAYAPSEQQFKRGNFIRKLIPGLPADTAQFVLGVDNGVVKHWVLGCAEGIVSYGKTEDWHEIERIKNMFKANMIIDANPYPAMPTMLARKYPGEVWLHYFIQDRKGEGMVRWSKAEPVVHVDRTKIIDWFAMKLADADPEPPYTFFQTGTDLEPYIPHFTVMHRIKEVNTQGIEKGMWVTPQGKADHWAFATFMCWVGIGQMPTDDAVSESAVVDPLDPMMKPVDKGYDPKEAIERMERARRRRT